MSASKLLLKRRKSAMRVAYARDVSVAVESKAPERCDAEESKAKGAQR